MLPKKHVFFGLAASLILFPIFLWKVLLFLIATVFIDFDHYLLYAIKKRDLNLKNAYAFLKILDEKQKRPVFKGTYTLFLCIFHTYEFLLIILILTITYNPIFPVFLGLIFHVTTDIISIKFQYNKKYFLFYLGNLSFVYHLFTRHKKRFGEINFSS